MASKWDTWTPHRNDNSQADTWSWGDDWSQADAWSWQSCDSHRRDYDYGSQPSTGSQHSYSRHSPPTGGMRRMSLRSNSASRHGRGNGKGATASGSWDRVPAASGVKRDRASLALVPASCPSGQAEGTSHRVLAHPVSETGSSNTWCLGSSALSDRSQVAHLQSAQWCLPLVQDAANQN